MSSLTLVILIGVMIAVVISVAIVLIKVVSTPQQVSGIQRLIKLGKLQAAQRLAKKVLSKNPRDYVAHYWLGEAYLADKKNDLALMEFKTVNQHAVFNGDIPEVTFRKKIASLYQLFNQNEEALREYMLLTKMDPKDAEHCYNAGKLCELTGHANQAMGFYQKAIQLNKKHAKAHAAIGYLMLRGKQYADARQEVDLAIRLDPNEFSNYYYLGKILKESKDFSGAVKAFEKAERDPTMRQKAFIERGSCYIAVNQTENAQAEFERAVKYSKDDAAQETLYARYFLAACYEKTHKIDKAIEQWDKIYAKAKNFRDVAAKLNEYKDIQANDSLKEYLTASQTQFLEICKKAALVGLKLVAQKQDMTPYGCSMLATEENKDNWMNVRQQIFQAEFYRNAEPLEDSVVRKVVDNVKAQNYMKGIIVSSSGFSPSAIAYAENRAVVLIGKEKLEAILSKAGV